MLTSFFQMLAAVRAATTFGGFCVADGDDELLEDDK